MGQGPGRTAVKPTGLSRCVGLAVAALLNVLASGIVLQASAKIPQGIPPADVPKCDCLPVTMPIAPSLPEIRDWNPLVITLSRGGCMRRSACPSYDVTVHGNGDVEFEGYRDVRATGRHTTHISRATVRALAAKFRAADFFALPDTRDGFRLAGEHRL